MATVIPASNWDFDPSRLTVELQPNHGTDLTTEKIIQSMDQILARPEMRELESLLLESPYFFKGRVHGM